MRRPAKTRVRLDTYPRPTASEAVFVDFETFADKRYSLRKMSSATYIMDDRFDVLSVAISEGADSRIDFYHKLGEEGRDLDAARTRLAAAALTGKILVVHNAGFDALLLKLHWGIEFARVFDTMSYLKFLGLAASLNNGAQFFGRAKKEAPEFTEASLRDPAKLREFAMYNAADVAVCRLIYRDAVKSRQLSDLECWAIESTAALGLRGISIDRPWLHKTAGKFSKARDAAYVELSRQFPRFSTDDINRTKVVREFCNNEFGAELASLAQRSPDLTEQRRSNADLGRFLDLRDRVQSWKRWADKARRLAEAPGRLYRPVRYYGAHTGRFAGGGRDSMGLNIQNLPAGKDPRFRELALVRGAFVPEPKNSFVAADLSSIEARVIAYLAEEQALLERFRSGEDIYVWFAQLAFPGLPIVKGGDNGHLRDLAKQAILGLGFGMGFPRFIEKLKITPGIDPPDRETAQHLYDLYQRTFPRIAALRKRYWNTFRSTFQSSGYGTGDGHCSFFPLVDRSGRGVRVVLPTGRPLFYRSVRVVPEIMPWGDIGDGYYYAGHYSIDAKAGTGGPGSGKRRKFEDGRVRNSVYSQVLVENIVQAVARDIMVAQMHILQETHSLEIAFSVHDEIVVSCPECTCPRRKEPQELGETIETLHEPGCPWIAARAVVEAEMSRVPPALPTLTDLPMGCEVSDKVRDRYGK